MPEYQPLVIGNVEFAMMDNIAYQPGRGNWLIHEDGEGATYTPARNNDIWDCLDDGEDEDNLADACVRVMTLNDLTAESTGGLFDASGKTYYVSVQHNVTGHGVILKVTGWRYATRARTAAVHSVVDTAHPFAGAPFFFARGGRSCFARSSIDRIVGPSGLTVSPIAVFAA